MNARELMLGMLREANRPLNLNEVCAMFPMRSRETVLEMLLYLVDCGNVRLNAGCPPLFARTFERILTSNEMALFLNPTYEIHG